MASPPDRGKNPGLDRTRHKLRASGVPNETPNPLRSGIHTRGYLPHVKREGAAYFVTFRLADSLPKEVLLRFQCEHAARLRALKSVPETDRAQTEEESIRELQRQIERFLDRGHGACHLRRPEVARIVRDVMLHFHEQWHVLDEWVVMPNHVHVVLWPMANHLLSDILKSWKQFSSRKAKKVLGLGAGAFWQRESFDHWIRSDAEKSRIRGYIRRNPVTAGLCEKPEDWCWSSAFVERGNR